MAAAKLKLVGRYRTWRPGVREGRLTSADGTTRRVLIRPLPDTPADPEVLQALRREAKILARTQHQDVLRVEHVTAFGGKAALVVEAVEGIDLTHVMNLLEERHQAIPLRAIVEIVAIVAAAFDAATAPIPGEDETAVMHPGPVPGEVLIDQLGRVKLAGLRVYSEGDPPPRCPEGYAPPEGIDPSRPSAYGLAALLVHLLTGAPPPPAGQDADLHERTLRRTTTRIAAKVGQAGWEDLVRIVRTTLAFEPQARLSPADFARDLRSHALEQRSPRLRTWAPAAIPGLCATLDPDRAKAGLDDPSQAMPPALPDPTPVVMGPGAPAGRDGLSAAFGPALEPGDEPSEDLATEVVSPELLARIRAAPLVDPEDQEKTLVARAVAVRVDDPAAPAPDPGPPPALEPPPALPPLDEAPLEPHKPLAEGGILPPLPIPDDAPTVKWSVGDEIPGIPPAPPAPSAPEPAPAEPPTEESARLATEEAPTAEHAEAPAPPAPPPAPLPDPGAIAPEPPDGYAGDDDEPLPHRRRSRAWLILLPLAAALLLGAWTAWVFLPGLIHTLTSGPDEHAELVPPEQPEPEDDELLSELLTPPPDPADAPEAPGLDLAEALLEQPEPPDRTEPVEAITDDPTAAQDDDPDQGDQSARDQAVAAIRDGQPDDPETVEDPEPTAPDEPVEPEPVVSTDPDPEPVEPDPVVTPEPVDEPVVADVAPDPVDDPPDAGEPDPPPQPVDATGLFRVEFRAEHPDIYELEVKCHQGSAKGAPPVVLNDAGKGPCRVTAFTNSSGRMIAWIGLTGPATLTCFADGQRACN